MRKYGEESLTEDVFDWYDERVDKMREYKEKEVKEVKEEAPKEETEYEKITNKLDEAITNLPLL